MKRGERKQLEIDTALAALYDWQYTVALAMSVDDLRQRYDTLLYALAAIEQQERDDAMETFMHSTEWAERKTMLDALYDVAHALGYVAE